MTEITSGVPGRRAFLNRSCRL